MSKPYQAAARRMTRKAWMSLGKAKEARNASTMLTKDDWLRPIMLEYSASMARIARSYSKQAVCYRQMDEVL